MNDDSEFGRSEESHINRRAILRGVGAAGIAGVAGVGTASARHQSRGPQEKCGCIDDSDNWGKYDFECVDYDEEEEECLEWDFVLSEGNDVVNITGWDGKDDDENEPITIYYQPAEGYAVSYVCAFGGRDNHDDDEPVDGVYESDLVNPGNQQAAISNLVFCVMETEETLPECPFYGTTRDDPTAINAIRYNPDAGEIIEFEVGQIPDDSADSNYPNGVAFDDDNDIWYFAEQGGLLKTMNEDGALSIKEYETIAGGANIAGAAFWDATGEYLFISQRGSSLMAAEIDGDDVETREVTSLDWSGILLGDLAIDRDGQTMYVSTVSSNAGSIFFSVDLDTFEQELIASASADSTEFATGKQIAFGPNDLWAHEAEGGQWWTVDVSDGSMGDVVATTDEYTDLARCGFADIDGLREGD